MTSHDVLSLLIRFSVALSLGVVPVMLLRVPIRRSVGAQAAYASWLMVPCALIATSLPGPAHSLAPLFATLPMMGKDTVTMAQLSVTAEAAVDTSYYGVCVWLIGVLVAAAYMAAQQWRYVRSLGRLEPFATGAMRASSPRGTPALVGGLFPRIVVPCDFGTRFTASERRLILAHERCHRARGDAQLNLVVALLRAANWCNPLVHIAAASFRFDQELACDACVIARFPETRRRYADAMLKAQLSGAAWQELRPPVSCLWPSNHPLTERIAMLKLPVSTPQRRVVAHVFIAVAMLAVGYASWAMQPAANAEPHPSLADSSAAADLAPVGGTAKAPATVAPISPPPTSVPSQPQSAHNDTAARDMAPSENAVARVTKPPHYPAVADKAKMGAKVVMKVFVDARGKASEASVESLDLVGTPKPGADGRQPDPNSLAEAFSKVSVATALTWTFEPARKNGKPVSGYVLVPIDFDIKDDCAKTGPCSPAAPVPAIRQTKPGTAA